MEDKLYKFLNGKKSKHGDQEWETGKWYGVEGELKMCENGYHASEHIQDALRYVQGDTLAVVEVDGASLKEHDKQCWQRMRIVETRNWTRIETLKLAIYSVELCRDNLDKKLFEDCISAIKDILGEYENGREPSDTMIQAARSAAWSAAWSARSAARSAEAAWSAAEAAEAAWSAAEEAWSARSAAEAAWSAAEEAWSARSEIKQKIHDYCLKITGWE